MWLWEWFSWHFPELSKIVSDNPIYAQLVYMLENKNNATEDMLEKIEEITLDEDKAWQIVEAAKISMG
jgi:nucleolar protein 56